MNLSREELIKLGIDAFKKKDISRARDYFIQANYKEGLIKIGDYYMYERRLPLLAYGYYKRAGFQEKIEELHQRMILALGKWIGEDKIKPESLKKIKEKTSREKWISVKVNPELLEIAKRIVNENKKQ